MTAVVPSDPVFDDPLRIALEPVRRALLEDARAAADRVLADATRRATRRVEEAERDASAAVESAERRGETSARVRADQALTQARSDAHGRILRVEEELRRRLHDRARTAARELVDDPRYPELIGTLQRLARDQLGPAAEIEEDPGGRGGIVAVAGSRRVDYTLPALAERALGSLADEEASLWA